MHHEIASAVQLLQSRDISVRQTDTKPLLDPLRLFFLFRQNSSIDAPKRVPLTTSYLTITQSNIDHSHMHLTRVMQLFPADVIGGSNKMNSAPKTVCVHWGGDTVDTDIAGDKHMFRRRGWVRRFFEANRIMAGDRVLLEQLGPYVYRVSKDSGPTEPEA